jgi:hypothetical protein
VVEIGFHGASLLLRRAVVCPLRDRAGSELSGFCQEDHYDTDVVCGTLLLGQPDKTLADGLYVSWNTRHSYLDCTLYYFATYETAFHALETAKLINTNCCV